MKFTTPSDVTYQVFGIRMSESVSAYSSDLRTIWTARKRPELLPPTFPWLPGGQMMRRVSSWKSETPMKCFATPTKSSWSVRKRRTSAARRSNWIDRESSSSFRAACRNRVSASASSVSDVPWFSSASIRNPERLSLLQRWMLVRISPGAIRVEARTKTSSATFRRSSRFRRAIGRFSSVGSSGLAGPLQLPVNRGRRLIASSSPLQQR